MMNTKHANSANAQDMEAKLRRQRTAAQTRHYLRNLPQFQTEQDLPGKLRDLLARLADTEARPLRR